MGGGGEAGILKVFRNWMGSSPLNASLYSVEKISLTFSSSYIFTNLWSFVSRTSPLVVDASRTIVKSLRRLCWWERRGANFVFPILFPTLASVRASTVRWCPRNHFAFLSHKREKLSKKQQTSLWVKMVPSFPQVQHFKINPEIVHKLQVWNYVLSCYWYLP